MKRLYLSFAIALLAACSDNAHSDDNPDDQGPGKPGSGGKLRLDGGSDAGADAGSLAGDSSAGDAGARADGGTTDGGRTDGAAAETFEGTWDVTLVATAATTCQGAQFEARIEDTWTFDGATLMGDHLGPNPYERAAGANVWNTGETTIAATADLELVGGALRGRFIFYRDTCNVFYDVKGIRE